MRRKKEVSVKVKVWGGRGSLPLAENSVFGGNTSCASVSLAHNELLVFDAGSGIVPLGQRLVEAGTPLPLIRVFLSHLHWDHIMGLPFFAPFFLSASPIEVFLPRDPVGNASAKLWQQMQFCGWSEDERRRCNVKFREIDEGEVLDFGAFSVNTIALCHPALDFGYRVSCAGKSFCYCTDVESLENKLLRNGFDLEEVRSGSIPWEKAIINPRHRELVRFLEGVDLCLHEAMYSRQEYSQKVGWGHSPVDFVTDMAYVARVQKLRLFHYSPDYSDAQLTELEAEIKERAQSFGEYLDVALAREGEEYVVE